MTKSELLLKFQLNALPQSVHQFSVKDKSPSELKRAAVLVAIMEDMTTSELMVVLTKRAHHLKHHGGQISFPGGGVQPSDKNLIATAVREAQEEIKLNSDNIEIIGQLHDYQTISGFLLTPIIAFISNKQAFSPDPNEVDEVFQAPIKHFLDINNHIAIKLQTQRLPRRVHFIPYQHYNIWGATAAILKDLSQVLR